MRTLFVLSAILLASCGKLKSSEPVTPPPPVYKPTAECLLAKGIVQDALKGDANVFHIDAGALSPESCFVMVSFSWAKNALVSLKKIKAISGKYSAVSLSKDDGSTVVTPIWLGEPAATWVPVVDPDTGKTLDNTETEEECEITKNRLAAEFPNAALDVVTNPQWTGCDVHAHFPTDQEFEAFFSWNNPYTLDHSLMMMHYRRPTGVVATVRIQPFAKY